MTDDREPFREASEHDVDDRAEMEERRKHGLRKRHEQRLENATYTAAEVKVLTEEACKVAAEAGRRIGRKEAGEEIEAACEADTIYDVAARHHFARIARRIARQPPEDATSGRTDPGMDSDLPQDSQAVGDACSHCGAYGGNGRIYRQDDTWDSCPACTPHATQEDE